MAHSSIPMLILQTDVEGLMKLNKTMPIKSKIKYSSKNNFMIKASRDNANLNLKQKNQKNQCVKNKGALTSKKYYFIQAIGNRILKISKIAKNKNTELNLYGKNDLNVFFRVCEISEQITSV